MDCTLQHQEEQFLHSGQESNILPHTVAACRALQYIKISEIGPMSRTQNRIFEEMKTFPIDFPSQFHTSYLEFILSM
jgi:hypothetical protein